MLSVLVGVSKINFLRFESFEEAMFHWRELFDHDVFKYCSGRVVVGPFLSTRVFNE